MRLGSSRGKQMCAFYHIHIFYLHRFNVRRGETDAAFLQQTYTDYFWFSV